MAEGGEGEEEIQFMRTVSPVLCVGGGGGLLLAVGGGYLCGMLEWSLEAERSVGVCPSASVSVFLVQIFGCRLQQIQTQFLFIVDYFCSGLNAL